MLQNPRKTLGFKKNMVYKIPPGGGGKPYPASGLFRFFRQPQISFYLRKINKCFPKFVSFVHAHINPLDI